MMVWQLSQHCKELSMRNVPFWEKRSACHWEAKASESPQVSQMIRKTQKQLLFWNLRERLATKVILTVVQLNVRMQVCATVRTLCE